MQFLSLLFIFNGALCSASILRRIYPPIRTVPVVGDDPGDPVFVTNLIESGQLDRARQLTEVRGLLEGVTSYSGYFTVNKGYDSNLFFWYFPAEKSPETAPVVLWLQGGPGGSSLYGLFAENGVFQLTKDNVVERREHYWSQVLNVIYIDNPVGTGFSFTGTDEGYARDEIRVGNDLYSALLQFFQLFPEVQKNDFFVTGESYAGKYVPAVAYTIHQNNEDAKQKINLKGVAIGDGLCDPEYQMVYSEYLNQIGIIDDNYRLHLHVKELQIIENIRAGKFSEAGDGFDSLFSSDFYNETGFNFFYNFLHDHSYGDGLGDIGEFVQASDVRRKIHVGNLTYHDGEEVGEFIKNDIMQSVKPWIEVLLEHYRVVFYNGQLDIIVAYPTTVNFLRTLNWSGAELYKTAPRKQWHVGTDLAGYTKTVKGMTEIVVRNAGHMVPADQSVWALDLITRIAFNKEF